MSNYIQPLIGGTIFIPPVSATGVEQLIAGANIDLSPNSGVGIVTVTGTGGGGGGGVTQILPGTGITVTPMGGTGIVTVTNSGSGGSVSITNTDSNLVLSPSPLVSSGTINLSNNPVVSGSISAGGTGSTSMPQFHFSGTIASPSFGGNVGLGLDSSGSIILNANSMVTQIGGTLSNILDDGHGLMRMNTIQLNDGAGHLSTILSPALTGAITNNLPTSAGTLINNLTGAGSTTVTNSGGGSWQVSSSGGGGSGTVTSVTGGTNINITGTATINPTVNLNATISGLTSVDTVNVIASGSISGSTITASTALDVGTTSNLTSLTVGSLTTKASSMFVGQTGDSIGSSNILIANDTFLSGLEIVNPVNDYADCQYLTSSGAIGNARFAHNGQLNTNNTDGEIQFITQHSGTPNIYASLGQLGLTLAPSTSIIYQNSSHVAVLATPTLTGTVTATLPSQTGVLINTLTNGTGTVAVNNGGGSWQINSTGSGGGTVTNISAASSNIVCTPTNITSTGTIDLVGNPIIGGFLSVTGGGTTTQPQLHFSGTISSPSFGGNIGIGVDSSGLMILNCNSHKTYVSGTASNTLDDGSGNSNFSSVLFRNSGFTAQLIAPTLSGNIVVTLPSTTGSLTYGGGGSPGGSTTQFQYNNSGSFGGASGLTYNNSTHAVATTNNTLDDGSGNTTIHNNLTVDGAVTSGVNGVSIVGNTNGVAVSAGDVGEVVMDNTYTYSSPLALTGANQVLSTFSLTAGNWDIWGNVFFFATSVLIKSVAGIDLTGTSTLPDFSLCAAYLTSAGQPSQVGLAVPMVSFRTSSTQAINLVVNGNGSTSPSVCGSLWARRRF